VHARRFFFDILEDGQPRRLGEFANEQGSKLKAEIKACFHYGCAALRVASDSER